MLAITAAWNSDTSHPSTELGARHQPIYPIVFKIFIVFKMDIGLDPLPELSDLKTCCGRNNSLNQDGSLSIRSACSWTSLPSPLSSPPEELQLQKSHKTHSTREKKTSYSKFDELHPDDTGIDFCCE
ncbi:hypothetical protein VitviT2T_006752 [Vitis vinifera]|uniref:Uncharacterized protein n=1 Tax=Vitis vinifera TaxID=29760 RepID=A0ABY9BXE5_VITVI|nr:hypothetical protein VitviT2T_006752 [Vitis vinifera]